MCVICKQARRSGRPWAGMTGAEAFWLPPGAAPPRAGAAGPPIRFGKRAYVRAVPQLAAAPHRTPVSCCSCRLNCCCVYKCRMHCLQHSCSLT